MRILACWIFLSSSAAAQLAPEGPQGQFQRESVEVDISQRVAVTTVTMDLANPGSRPMEGSCHIPLPPGAVPTDLRLWINNRPVSGRVYDTSRARRGYETVVRRQIDPALAELLEDGTLRVRIFPIPPGKSRRFSVTYVEVLPLIDGNVTYLLPARAPSKNPGKNPSCEISLRIRETAMGKIDSTHAISILTRNSSEVRFRVRGPAIDRKSDLLVTYQNNHSGPAWRTERRSKEDGYFLLVMAGLTRTPDFGRSGAYAVRVLTAGDHRVVIGRYRTSGLHVVTLPETTLNLPFAPERKESECAVAALWAAREVEALLGNPAEIKSSSLASAVKLARAHRIVTPCTAFIVLESDDMYAQFVEGSPDDGNRRTGDDTATFTTRGSTPSDGTVGVSATPRSGGGLSLSIGIR